MTTDSARPRTRRRLFLWIPLAIVAIVAGGIFAFVRTGANARKAAIERIQMANEPLLPGDLKLASGRAGKDPAEWLSRVDAVKNTWEMHDLADATSYRKLLESAQRRDFGGNQRAEFGEDARVAFGEFETCIEKLCEGQKDPADVWNRFWNTLDGLLQVSDGTSDWGECPAKALSVLALGLESSMKLAREAHEYGPIDPQVVAKVLDRENESVPRLPMVQVLRLHDAVQVCAIHDAQSKRFAPALDDVRAGLAVARIHQPSSWVAAAMLWTVGMNRTLDALQAVLPLLPRGMDVTDIDDALTAARPRDELAAALKGERAFGNRVFESIHSGKDLMGMPLKQDFFHRWLSTIELDRDQAEYLDALTRAAERSTKPAFLRAPAKENDSGGMWHLSSIMTPTFFEGRFAAADTLEARLALAHAAITAYRQGAKDTLAFLKNSVDPFDGKNLRCAFGAGKSEGLIVFWSVGTDKHDDGGTDPSKDIVWRLRLE